ncbi:AAA family ATPase [Alteribacillus sp. HJP-4]|uniref:AAA family ATPase n=1 Tax=Alteribacillus sp. HJP-4 TaxID=2775394 RepID=UPI0035CD1A41
MLLQSVTLDKQISENTGYPFSLPIIQNFQSMHFQKPVTIFVGENGSGKSTLLEAIASNIGSILISGGNIDDDPSLEPARQLAAALKLSWKLKTKAGFFFRANDFNTFTSRIAAMKRESQQRVDEIKKKDPFSLEVMPYARTLGELKDLYGEGLEYRSHGESFLDLFQARFREDGLYILDEPEAPLSPLKQLSLISLINEMVEKNGQFIIATHSPILMALPGADIYSMEEDTFVKRDYQDLEHVRLTKDFLNNPSSFLRHL